jgi:hypothetical protein
LPSSPSYHLTSYHPIAAEKGRKQATEKAATAAAAAATEKQTLLRDAAKAQRDVENALRSVAVDGEQAQLRIGELNSALDLARNDAANARAELQMRCDETQTRGDDAEQARTTALTARRDANEAKDALAKSEIGCK